MRFKTVLKRFFKPPAWAVIFAAVTAAALLVAVFSFELEKTPLAYFSYLYSAYALVASALLLKRVIPVAYKKLCKSALVRKIDKLPYVHRLFNDLTFRGVTSIYQGLALNSIYVLFRIVTAVIYRSVWFWSVAGYYIMLIVVRTSLIYCVRTEKKCKNAYERSMHELKGYRLCGILMLALHVGMDGMVFQMVLNEYYFYYPGYLIYVVAIITFYHVITAIVNLIKFRKLKNPLLYASKMLSFVGALVSVLTLQTAMLTHFGDNAQLYRTQNVILGNSICFIAAAISIFMIIDGSVKLNRLKRSV